MNYNISFDVAALILLFALYVFNKLQHKESSVEKRTNQYLHVLLIVTAFSSALDIVLCLTISGYYNMDMYLLLALAQLYYVTVFSLPLFFSLYLIDILRLEFRNNWWVLIPSGINVFLLLMFNTGSGLYFYFTDSIHYYHGPLFFLIYSNWAIYFCVIFYYSFVHRRALGKTRFVAMLMLLVIGVIGSLAELITPNSPLISFAVVICLWNMYITFHYGDERIDPLTGLLSREGFFLYMHDRLHIHRDVEYILILLNIRHFKILNEMFGSEGGDEILRTVADAMERRVGKNGLCGHLHIDHFAIFMPKEELKANQLIEDNEHLIKRKDFQCSVHFTFGIYEIDDPTISLELMFNRANMALQKTRDNLHLNYVVFENTMYEEFKQIEQIESEMRTALKEHQFELYLQPICRIGDGKIISAEALVRWQHPSRGMISPAEFVPLFERNGFVRDLDQYMWEGACQILQNWKQHDKPVVPLEVNVSRLSLYNQNLSYDIINLIQKHNLKPSDLRLEITESAYDEISDSLMESIRNLKTLDFQILMDDFGSGYSNLNALKDMPVDYLKMDMRFLSEKKTSAKAKIILSSLIQLAHRLGLFVIVEGIETKEHIDFLNSVQCQYGQGYYFYEPMTVSAFEELLEQGK